MSQDSPASILFDKNSNPIGVIADGYTYRLQVESKVALDDNSFLSADKSVFGAGIIGNRLSQIAADFSGQLTDQFNNDVGQVTSGGAAIIPSNGFLRVSSGTASTSYATIFTNSTLKYYPGREIYAQKTAGFTIPTDPNSEQRIGTFDGYNGFFIGFHGMTFGITLRNLSVDTFTPRSAFNGDKLDGNPTSKFTRDGVPEALNVTFENVYRTRFGWLGAAPIYYEIMAPDGHWVTFHTIRQPNTSATPSISNPNVPIAMEIVKTNSDATDLSIVTSSWDGGIVDSPQSPFKVFPTFSLLNSTTTLLRANESFTGLPEAVSDYVSIDTTILSDQISAPNGFVVEWSQDSINFAYSESFTIPPNIGGFFSFAPRAKYFRLSFTNGSVDQNSFSLTTAYYPLNRSVYVQNLDTDVPPQKATEVVRAVVAAQKQGPGSVYTNLQATSAGLLKVSVDTAVFPPINHATVIQKNNTGPIFASDISAAFHSNVHLGNTLVAVVIQGQGTFNEPYDIVDTFSNSYTKAAGTHNVTPSGSSIDVWFAISSATGANTVFANNFPNDAHLAMQVYEISGLLTTNSPVDKIAAFASLGTALSVGPVVTGSNGEFCVAAYGTDTPTVISAGAGWTSDLSVAGFGCFSQVQNTAGTILGTASTPTSVNSIDVLVTFLPAVTTKPIQTDQSGRLIVVSEISDGYNGPATVKAPFTAATSADQAVVVAISPNNPITVMEPRPGTNNTSSVPASTANVVLLAPNSIRLGATIYNDSSALLYVKLGGSASVTDFTVKLFPLGYYEIPYRFSGEIDGLWNFSDGFARVGEILP